MITDIHSHIIPGVDDGAKDMEEALLMLKMAADDGTEHIIATPHLVVEGDIIDFDRAKEGLEKLRALAKAQDIKIELHMGCEAPLVISKLADAVKAGVVPTLAGSDYVLVEFYQRNIVYNFEGVIRDLLNKGYKPVIAHPERCLEAKRRPKELAKLVKLGALLQVNAESVTDGITSKAAISLLKSGLVSFVASDAHGALKRKPVLSFARKLVLFELGSKAYEDIFYKNPSKILEK